jgi:cytoskeleton protein RodZ
MVDSIGQRFREARQARSLSLEEIAQATRIRVRYLAALESGDYETLPSAAQARGFLRAYASYLGLDPKPLLEDLHQEAPYFSVSPPTTPVRRVETAVVNQAEAEEIFVELGENLRSQREVLGLSLEDIERHTHLRIHYLKALEAGDINRLPSPVQGRGMLSNYASFLGMDSEAMLLRFASGLQAKLAARQVSAPRRRRPLVQYRPISTLSPLRRLLSVDFLVGSFIVIFLVGFVLWGGSRIAGIRSEEAEMTATSTAPSIADVLVAAPTLETTLTPTAEQDELLGESLPATPEAALAMLSEDDLNLESSPDSESGEPDQLLPPIEGSSALQVYIMVRQRAWMRVLVDGQVEFDGRVIPGSAYPFSGDESIEILTGNGAALEVFFNQDELGPLGALGEVVQRVFSVQGVQTPTPTLTFTPLPPTPTSPTSTPTLNETELPLGSPTP